MAGAGSLAAGAGALGAHPTLPPSRCSLFIRVMERPGEGSCEHTANALSARLCSTDIRASWDSQRCSVQSHAVAFMSTDINQADVCRLEWVIISFSLCLILHVSLRWQFQNCFLQYFSISRMCFTGDRWRYFCREINVFLDRHKYGLTPICTCKYIYTHTQCWCLFFLVFFLPYTSVGGRKRIWLFILNPKLFFFSEQTKYDSAT